MGSIFHYYDIFIENEHPSWYSEDMSNLHELEIANHCKKVFHSEQTKKIYATALNDYLGFCGKESIYDTSEEDGKKYCRMLEQRVKDGTLSESTMNNMLYRLKSISKASVACVPQVLSEFYSDPFEHVWPVNPDNTITEESLPSHAEITATLSAAEETDTTFYLLLCLILYCGMSLQEMLRLTPSHIHTNFIDVPTYYTRHITAPARLMELLRNLMKNCSASDPIFRNRQNKPYNAKYVERHVAQFSNYNIREIRNFALVSMFAYGIDAASFSKYTGIKKQIYYKRYSDKAKHITPSLDYSHIPKA